MGKVPDILKSRKGVFIILGAVLCLVILFIPTGEVENAPVASNAGNPSPSNFNNYDRDTPLMFETNEVVEPVNIVRQEISGKITTLDPEKVRRDVETQRAVIAENRDKAVKPYGLGLYRKSMNAVKAEEVNAQQKLEQERERALSLKLRQLELEKLGSEKVDFATEPLPFAPYGRMLRCKLVNTVDSFNLQTPVVGLVMEDLYWNGRLLVPAGSEVHGSATTNRVRSRIATADNWLIVLPAQGSRINGATLRVTGAALDHSPRSPNGGEYAISDGSYGLLGETITSDNLNEIRLFAATFLSAATSGLQTTETTIAGTTSIQPDSRNAALGGVSAVMNEFAQQIKGEIERNGYYTRVPAGKDFYLYITQTLELADARVGEDRITDFTNTGLLDRKEAIIGQQQGYPSQGNETMTDRIPQWSDNMQKQR